MHFVAEMHCLQCIVLIATTKCLMVFSHTTASFPTMREGTHFFIIRIAAVHLVSRNFRVRILRNVEYCTPNEAADA
jgi:hypothetical protein